MQNVRKQCEALYVEAFGDDKAFKDLLFDLYFENGCRYITHKETVVSMLIAIDVTANGKKGKYIYAVCTKKEYRGKGYMHRLFEKVKAEFSSECYFLCLKPAREELYSLYEREGFYKKLVRFNAPKLKNDGVLIKDTDLLKKIRDTLAPKNSIVYDEQFYRLVLCYCDAWCDDINAPSYLCIAERSDLKVIELLTLQNRSESEAVSVIWERSSQALDGYYLGLPLS